MRWWPARRAGGVRGRRTGGWLERFTLLSGPDVIGMLVAQGEVSVRAMEEFAAWSAGAGPDSARRLRALEHAADDARKRLVAELRAALATPIGQEDLYVLSERCDRVVNRAKNIAGEAEAIGWEPDARAAEMAEALRAGMESVVAGFRALGEPRGDAAAAANRAIRHTRRVDHVYRAAMAELLGTGDLREVFSSREIYRSYVRTAEALESVGDRLWYAVLAEP